MAFFISIYNKSMNSKFLLFSLLALLFPLNIVSQKSQSLIRRAKIQEQKGNNASSINTTNEVIEICEKAHMKHKDSVFVMQAYTIKAKNYSDMGDLAQSLKFYKSAIGYAEKLNDKEELADLYNNVFSIYYRKHNYANAKDLLKTSLDLSLSIKDSARIRRIYNNAALIEYEQNNYKEALSLIDKAIAHTPQTENIPISLILTNKAEIFFKMGRLKQAEQTLKEALKRQGDIITEKTIQTPLNYALVKAYTGDKAGVKLLIEKILHRLKGYSLPTKENAYKELTEISFTIGDSISGFHYMKTGMELSDSLSKIENEAQLQQLIVSYDTERLKKQNDLLQQEIKTRNAIVSASIIIILLIIVFSIILYRRMKIDKYKSRLITEQKERLLKMEQEEHERNKREMNIKLDHKNRQLTSYTIDLSATNAFHKKMEKEINEIEQAVIKGEPTENIIKKLKETRSDISHYDSQAVDNDFRIYFEEVHPGYIKNLSKAYPHLSDNDLRMCAYLLLGMSTKEIASLTFREVRSIESARNRLRKKLNLPAETNLKDFLNDKRWSFNNMQ